MENPNYTEIVSEAAKMLDEHDPGWYKEIDKSTLNINDCRNCIFGQRYGGYGAGVAKYKLYGDAQIQGIGLAFSGYILSGEYVVDKNPHPEMTQKTQLWLDEINSRLEADRAKSADAFIERTNEIINQPLQEDLHV